MSVIKMEQSNEALPIVGNKVSKISGKPFKSKSKINTIKKITVNPNTNRQAATFIEDDSVVDLHILKCVD